MKISFPGTGSAFSDAIIVSEDLQEYEITVK